jgi:hypothetical protein
MKKQHGIFYTRKSPFTHPVFLEWLKQIPTDTPVLEPFAGNKMIPSFLRALRFDCFDLFPADDTTHCRDTLADFPQGYRVCITNPPYLAKNSAKRNALLYPPTPWDDVYKMALSLILTHCEYAAVIIPQSFLTSSFPKERLQAAISLTYDVFNDTTVPVLLALFGRDTIADPLIYEFNGTTSVSLSSASSALPIAHTRVPMKFNEPAGQIGLLAVDLSSSDKHIRFCLPSEVPNKVTHSSRSYTRIYISLAIKDIPALILEANRILNGWRASTADVMLAPFKGVRKDGRFRRRLDYATARAILDIAIQNLAD